MKTERWRDRTEGQRDRERDGGTEEGMERQGQWEDGGQW